MNTNSASIPSSGEEDDGNRNPPEAGVFSLLGVMDLEQQVQAAAFGKDEVLPRDNDQFQDNEESSDDEEGDEDFHEPDSFETCDIPGSSDDLLLPTFNSRGEFKDYVQRIDGGGGDNDEELQHHLTSSDHNSENRKSTSYVHGWKKLDAKKKKYAIGLMFLFLSLVIIMAVLLTRNEVKEDGTAPEAVATYKVKDDDYTTLDFQVQDTMKNEDEEIPPSTESISPPASQDTTSSSTSPVSSSHIVGTNLVSNPGFENGLKHWHSNTGTIHKKESDALSGKHSVLCKDKQSSNGICVEQMMTGKLEANKRYHVSCWAKLKNEASSVLKLMLRTDDDGGQHHWSTSTMINNSSWTLVEGETTLDNVNGTLSAVILLVSGAAGVEFFVDDFSVVLVSDDEVQGEEEMNNVDEAVEATQTAQKPSSPAPPPTVTEDAVGITSPNLILNPDFEEDGLDPWYAKDGSKIKSDSSEAHSGKQSVLCKDRTKWYHGVEQDMMGQLEANKTYRISCWAKLKNAASSDFKVTLRTEDDNGKSYWKAEATINDSSWTLVEGVTTVAVQGTLTGLKLNADGPDAGVEYFVDDCAAVLVSDSDSPDIDTSTTEKPATESSSKPTEDKIDALAEQLHIAASAVAHIAKSTSDETYDQPAPLLVGHKSVSLIRFDLPSLPVEKAISKAALNLYLKSTVTDNERSKIKVMSFKQAGKWTNDGSVSWKSLSEKLGTPHRASHFYVSPMPSNITEQLVEVDVTSKVDTIGEECVTFELSTESEGVWEFGSGDEGDEDMGPKLVIDLVDTVDEGPDDETKPLTSSLPSSPVAVVDSTNLILNPNFEDDGLDPWYAASGGTIKSESSEVHSGNLAVLSKNRNHPWHGVGQSINARPEASGTYQYHVSCWAKLKNEASSVLKLSLHTQDDDGKHHGEIGSTINSSYWTNVEGDIKVDVHGTLKDFYVKIDGPEAGVQFWVDDCSVMLVP